MSNTSYLNFTYGFRGHHQVRDIIYDHLHRFLGRYQEEVIIYHYPHSSLGRHQVKNIYITVYMDWYSPRHTVQERSPPAYPDLGADLITWYSICGPLPHEESNSSHKNATKTLSVFPPPCPRRAPQ